MQTETRTVPKLEFVPLPDEATAPCLVSLPPVDSSGQLPYEALPAYTARVLGTLEDCNDQLDAIRQLQPVDPDDEDIVHGVIELQNDWNTPVLPPVNYSGEPMIVRVFPFSTHEIFKKAFNQRTGHQYRQTAEYLRAASLTTTFTDGTRYCEIFVVAPKIYNDPEWHSWGHELGHCVWDTWHNQEEWKDIEQEDS